MRCPDCGGGTTAITDSNLSSLGYRHRDDDYVCEDCGNRFTRGIPLGEPDDDTWICDACGGDLMPHFMYVFGDEARVKPKCQECYYVPDDPITLDVSDNGTARRVFIGHHTTTGSREEAEPNTY